MRIYKLIKYVILGQLLNIVPSFAQSSSECFIDSVVVEDTYLPVIIGQAQNPVLKIKVFKNNNLKSTIKRIEVELKDKITLKNTEALEIYYTSNNSEFNSKNLFGRSNEPKRLNILAGTQPLERGVNYFWVTINQGSQSDLFDKIDVDCNLIVDSLANKLIPIRHKNFQRSRPAIGFHGESSIYGHRIFFKNPGLITTNKGTLVGVFDMRHHSRVDLQADIDVGMVRSEDQGKSWSPVKVIMDMGEYGNLPQNQNGITDPTILYDKKRNVIWVAGLWVSGMENKKIVQHSQTGLAPTETGQFILVKSEDDGLTWSEPINITKQVKDPSWRLFFQGPGKGIMMSDGTLVFPAQIWDQNNIPHSTIIYSKDGGVNWTTGVGAKSETTEAQVVELKNGSLMLNMRDNRGGSRSVYVTHDLGKTWQIHPTSRKALPEPVCQASIIRFNYKNMKENKELLLFSNPNSAIYGIRKDMSIKISDDEGMSWPKAHYVLLDAVTGAGYNPKESPMGYSCLTQIDEKTIGIMYGSSRSDLVFQKIDISEILKLPNQKTKD